MIINTIDDLATYLGSSVESLKRDVYKYTDCGAWINWDNKHVSVGSIVEGSDAEFSNTFSFPFTSDEYEAWLEELDVLTDEEWTKANVEYGQVEMCPYCEWENEYPYWDVDEKGFIAECKHCGRKIFLCDACMHHEDNPCMNCDWRRSETGRGCFRGWIDDTKGAEQ